ncbi:MAG TPA: SIMPL domain-containing protein [Salinimicrobium catena]|uniref:SIMPL domain-containing protein n=1 Tax=Salinimicrobium catena TaxID=390640 RepID=A0A7C2RR25_9FLAO|nr:SIMPL domain-containing protein [Salinimicrobium catena]
MKYIVALLFSIAIVLAAYILGSFYLERATPQGVIAVTGSGSEDFTSDLIVWEGTFSQMNTELQVAYEQLNSDKETVREYLISKGIQEDNLVFNSVQTIEQREPQYRDGNYVGEIFKGYLLQQTVKIESKDVAKVEQVSREITELLQKGVQFNSTPPRYYYTKLADLKIQMISAATEDARTRAEKIAENSGSELGSLRSADLGVFQIIGQNSGEDFTWGGAYNTTDKKKTASVTMRLEFEID